MKNLVLIVMLLYSITAFGQSETTGIIKSEAKYQSEIMKVTRILDDPAILDSLVQKAYRNAPVIQALNQEMAVFDEEYLQKKRNWVSSFRFGVNIFSANTSLSADNQSVTTYGVLPNLGLNLSIDPEKLVNRKSSMRQAEDKKARIYYLQQDQMQVLKSKVINLYYEYLSCLEALVIRQHTLDSRKQHLNVFEVDFRNGNRGFDELLVIQHQVYLAEESLMSEQIRCLKMKAEIEILLGLK